MDFALELAKNLPSEKRTIVAIGGPPGAGKTTLALDLADALTHRNRNAVAVSMDGWHLSNRQLTLQGKSSRKGATDTFDTDGLAWAIWRMKTQSSSSPDIYLPSFSRDIDDPVASDIVVSPKTEVIILEGNYLLLKSSPWMSMRASFDVPVYCDVKWDVCRNRLIDRQMSKRGDLDESIGWVDTVDYYNFDVVSKQSDLTRCIRYDANA